MELQKINNPKGDRERGTEKNMGPAQNEQPGAASDSALSAIS